MKHSHLLQNHMQNGMIQGQGQPPHSAAQAPMHHHNSMHHPPQASPLDSQGGHSPTSSNTSQTPQTTPTSVSSGGNSRDVPKICGRPGCTNPVQRSPDGWQSDFCSNECVVGQCRDVYTTWSSSSTQQGPQNQPGNPYMSQPQAQTPPQPPVAPPNQQQTAVVK